MHCIECHGAGRLSDALGSYECGHCGGHGTEPLPCPQLVQPKLVDPATALHIKKLTAELANARLNQDKLLQRVLELRGEIDPKSITVAWQVKNGVTANAWVNVDRAIYDELYSSHCEKRTWEFRELVDRRFVPHLNITITKPT